MNIHAKRFLSYTIVPVVTIALYFISAIIAGVAVAAIFDDDLSNHTGTFTLVDAIISLCIFGIFMLVRTMTQTNTIMGHKLDGKTIGIIALIAFGMAGFSSMYFLGVDYLISNFDVPFISDSLAEYTEMMDESSPIFAEKVIEMACTVLLIPFVEEFMFRGVVLDSMLSCSRPSIAIITTSLLFGLLHGQPIQIIYAFFGGLALGSIYYLTRSIWASVLMHMVFNLFGGVIPMLIPENDVVLTVIIYLLELFAMLLLPVCFFYLSKKRRAAMELELKDKMRLEGISSEVV